MHYSRRQFLAATATIGAGVSLAIPTDDAAAAWQCTPFNQFGVQQCTVGLAFPDIVAQRQIMNQWCWAACIAGIFNWHGHPVSQQAFVNKVFGGTINYPAVGPQIFGAINGYWIDANGRGFYAECGVLLDGNYGYRNAFTTETAASDLANNYPLIIGSQGHATVLTAMSYAQDTMGRYELTELIVRDPWPQSPSRRPMSRTEVTGAMFLAQVRTYPA